MSTSVGLLHRMEDTACAQFTMAARLFGATQDQIDGLLLSARAESLRSPQPIATILQLKLSCMQKGQTPASLLEKVTDTSITWLLPQMVTLAIAPNICVRAVLASTAYGPKNIEINFRTPEDAKDAKTRGVRVQSNTRLQGTVGTVLAAIREPVRQAVLSSVCSDPAPRGSQNLDTVAVGNPLLAWTDKTFRMAAQTAAKAERVLLQCSHQYKLAERVTSIELLHRAKDGRTAAVPPTLTTICISDEIAEKYDEQEIVGFVIGHMKAALVGSATKGVAKPATTSGTFVATTANQAYSATGAQSPNLASSTSVRPASATQSVQQATPTAKTEPPPQTPAQNPVDVARFDNLELDDDL